jgi:predicted DCC family thiol-disulfide oxidoreductase YuxK
MAGQLNSSTKHADDLHQPSIGKHIVFFDGVCGFCNRFIQVLLEKDKQDAFHFASLQSEFANATLAKKGINSADLNTVYIIANYGTDKEKVLNKSDAIVFAAGQLDWWIRPFATIFGFFPKPLRNFGYDIVAKIRYRLFGKLEHCMLPSPEARAKFIEQ